MPFLYQTFFNFRNLKNDTIDLSSSEIYFVGENGQGKSNILESLYYSSYGISFRTHTDSQIIKRGEKSMSLNSLYKGQNNDVSKISVILDNGKKRIEKDSQKIQDRKELVNTIPCILFCHDDLKFAVGEPEYRRFFIDQSLTLYDSLYIDDLRNYKKIVKSRNSILKSHNYEMIEVFDKQLAETGEIIQEKRKKAVFYFNQIFGKIYEEISGIKGISINYEPSWKEIEIEGRKETPDVNFILELLNSKREQDKMMETTMSGPHRDKINFVGNDKKLFVPIASTGQCRLISLLLRVAQSVYFTRKTGLKPVILMDDVLLELDPEKRKKITSMIPEYDQLFCTFLPGEPYEKYMKDSTKILKIQDGGWTDVTK